MSTSPKNKKLLTLVNAALNKKTFGQGDAVRGGTQASVAINLIQKAEANGNVLDLDILVDLIAQLINWDHIDEILEKTANLMEQLDIKIELPKQAISEKLRSKKKRKRRVHFRSDSIFYAANKALKENSYHGLVRFCVDLLKQGVNLEDIPDYIYDATKSRGKRGIRIINVNSLGNMLIKRGYSAFKLKKAAKQSA